MFSKHYQSELAFLRAAGKIYAEANPSTAGLLAERGGDPDVERLLEGFAFLVARVRERIDDAVPEVVHDLAETLLPHYLRSVPSCTIVEMQPFVGSLRARSRLRAGVELGTPHIEGTSCRFRTTADLDLLPITVQDVQLDHAIGASPVLRIQLQIPGPAAQAVFQPEGIRLFLHGDLPFTSTLLLWLARYLRGVSVKKQAGGTAVELPTSSVRLVGLEPEFPLLPWPALAPQGYRLLQEYFTLPQKMLFFELRDLHLVGDPAAATERFEVALRFDRPPELPAHVSRDCIRTNCVPAVNLFRASAEPVTVCAVGEEHLIRAAGSFPMHMEIHGVENVVGFPREGARIEYQPFVGFRQGSSPSEMHAYRLRRALSPIDGGLDTYISVTRPASHHAAFEPETLSFDVMATNRGLPARLRIGDVSEGSANAPTQTRFRNIVPPSPPVRPPLGAELHWRLIAHLAANRASVASPENLRSMLGLYNFQLLADQQAGRGNQLRVESVREVSSALATRLVSGAPVRGTRLSVGVDEAGFAGPGDAFLFGCALDELLAAQASLSSFVELSLRLEPSQREYAWRPRNGRKALL